MKQPHKNAEIIKAWADGAEIEFRTHNNVEWSPVFKGWSWDGESIIEHRFLDNTSNAVDFTYPGWLEYWDMDRNYKWFFPETLDDFIRDCQRAGIDLEFKEVV